MKMTKDRMYDHHLNYSTRTQYCSRSKNSKDLQFKNWIFITKKEIDTHATEENAIVQKKWSRSDFFCKKKRRRGGAGACEEDSFKLALARPRQPLRAFFAHRVVFWGPGRDFCRPEASKGLLALLWEIIFCTKMFRASGRQETRRGVSQHIPSGWVWANSFWFQSYSACIELAILGQSSRTHLQLDVYACIRVYRYTGTYA